MDLLTLLARRVSLVVTVVGLAACGSSNTSTFANEGQSCATTSQCAEGLVCGPTRTCTPANGSSGGLGSSGGVPEADGGSGDGGICAQVDIAFTPTTPVVGLVLDKSASMQCKIDETGQVIGQCTDPTLANATARWNVLRTALFADTGAVKQLEARVYFGGFFFGPASGCGLDTGLTVAPALGNFGSLKTKFDGITPNANTPTGAALEQTSTALVAFNPKPNLPKYMVLATDGYPTACDGEDPLKRAVDAATAAFTAKVTTFVVGIGAGLANQNANFQKIANVGQGFPPDTAAASGAKFFLATDAQGLTDEIGRIIRGVRTCDFTLDARIDPANASRGTVTVDGKQALYNDPNGWKLLDGNDRIQFVGDACKAVLAGAEQVKATFPCDAGVVKVR